MDANGFTRCDGFVGHVPQNFINNNMPVCPLCGSPDPYWTLKDKIEFTAHRVMFRCQHCGGVLSATQNDFDGTTKSTAYAILNSGGAMNALIKKRQGKDVKTVYMKVVDVGACRTTNELQDKELPLEEFQRMAASFSAQPQNGQPVQAAPLDMSQVQVSYGQPAQPQAVPVQPTPVQPQPIPVQPQPIPVQQPLNMDQVQVHYEQPQYVPPQPVYVQPQYVQPQYVQPQYVQPQPTYAQPQSSATTNAIQQSLRMPIASIIMMCMVLTIQMFYVMQYASIYTLSYFAAYGLILTGMLMYKKNLQLLVGIGFLLLATAELSNVIVYNEPLMFTDMMPIMALLTLGIAFFIPKASVSMGLRIAGVSISFIADIIWIANIIEWYPVESLMLFLITQSCLSAAVLLLKPNKR